MKIAVVFQETGRFAGWPANYGMWRWDDEIVVGFTVGAHQTVKSGHAIDKRQPFINIQARSLDGGRSWQVEPFKGALPGGRGLSADEHMAAGLRLAEVMDARTVTVPREPLDFTKDDFALMLARTGLARGVFSFFYVSSDRCHNWAGPFRLPDFGETGIAARSDVIVQGAHEATFFLTVNKADGQEGRIICVHTRDGGRSFQRLSQVGADLDAHGDFSIMPSSLQLPERRLLCARRCRIGVDLRSHIDLFASDDLGKSWRWVSQPVRFEKPGHSGNPPCLLALRDGRLALLYGNRDSYAICARISEDGGITWSGEIVLRGGGANGDMGYVRAVVLDDGTVVAAYYFNDRPDGDGERFIEAAIWQP
ncbi:MAG: sialidase family protein [Chloroflexi bacterium]|nr:sialidase family protein [Chloroflexota bacterium]MCY4246759.1 sialidase family protein [Chloroflexota bacterium]